MGRVVASQRGTHAAKPVECVLFIANGWLRSRRRVPTARSELKCARRFRVRSTAVVWTGRARGGHDALLSGGAPPARRDGALAALGLCWQTLRYARDIILLDYSQLFKLKLAKLKLIWRVIKLSVLTY